MKEKVVAVVSGGLDSTTLLYYIINKGYDPTVVTFDYGQKHKIEIRHAITTCIKLDVPQHVLKIPILPGSSLTEEDLEVPKEDYSVESQKSTVVPNRNMVFLSIAASYAIAHGASEVYYAAHWNDKAVYPDCTVPFIRALTLALNRGNYEKLQIVAPFVNMTKAEIVSMGWRLKVPFEDTWSCYDPVTLWKAEGLEYPHNLETPTVVHCGKCGTCRERIEAFKTAGVEDPTVYAKEVK